MALSTGRSRSPRVRLAALYAGRSSSRIAGTPPRVAIVGAGLAGLVAAHFLKQAGCEAEIFDAADRVGGRMRTDFGRQESGVICEQGGEFIDSTHQDMLALVRFCGLSLIDTEAGDGAALSTAYHFDRQHYDEDDIVAAFASIAPQIAADAARLTPAPSRRRHTLFDIEMDRVSIAEYLARLDMEHWLRGLLNVAYETEFGLDTGELSSIGLLTMIGTDLAKGFAIFGQSDERFKVTEGVERIPLRLAEGLASQLRFGHRLVRLAASGAGCRLSFGTGGATVEVEADIVILALPFTMLRQVEIDGLLPAAQRRCIDTLGYGTNAKLSVGLHSRLWVGQGYEGGLYTDQPMQTGWDASRQRAGERGIYTWFLGGRAAMELGVGDANRHADRFAQGMNAVFTGFDAGRTGSTALAHWPGEPFAQGSYSCYRVGQWTALSGLEGRRAANVLFAGEHCSRAFQGYMNGAAETGRRAALTIIGRCA